MTALTRAELYETLTSGAAFKLRFTTKLEADLFQKSLSKIKWRSEKDIKALGIPLDKMHLTMSYDTEACVATFQLKPPVVQTFEILEIIPPNP